MYLKLTTGVKRERARMPVFKAILLELLLSSATALPSGIRVLSITASQAEGI